MIQIALLGSIKSEENPHKTGKKIIVLWDINNAMWFGKQITTF